MVEDISNISGVGPATLEKLEEGNITSLDDIANASVEELTSIGMSNNKAKKIIHEAKKSTVQIQTGLEVEEEFENKNKISSGIDTLDEAMEGGFTEQALISVWGESGTGKSQLCMKALVEGVEQTGKEAIYVETERDRFRPQRIKSLSTKDDTLEKINRVKAYSIDQQYNSYDKIMEAFSESSIVVVDSLTARIRLSSDFQGRGSLSERSTELGDHLVKLEEVGERLNCPVLFTNQAYKNPDSYGKNVLQYGGAKIRHTSQFFIFMDTAQGEMYSATVQNHPATGNTEAVIDIKEDDVVGV